jgi:hypothetical protein
MSNLNKGKKGGMQTSIPFEASLTQKEEVIRYQNQALASHLQNANRRIEELSSLLGKFEK